jgi:hypothetical protein
MLLLDAFNKTWLSLKRRCKISKLKCVGNLKRFMLVNTHES